MVCLLAIVAPLGCSASSSTWRREAIKQGSQAPRFLHPAWLSLLAGLRLGQVSVQPVRIYQQRAVSVMPTRAKETYSTAQPSVAAEYRPGEHTILHLPGRRFPCVRHMVRQAGSENGRLGWHWRLVRHTASSAA